MINKFKLSPKFHKFHPSYEKSLFSKIALNRVLTLRPDRARIFMVVAQKSWILKLVVFFFVKNTEII